MVQKVKQHTNEAELVIVPPLLVLTMLSSVKTNVSHVKNKESFLKSCLSCLHQKSATNYPMYCKKCNLVQARCSGFALPCWRRRRGGDKNVVANYLKWYNWCILSLMGSLSIKTPWHFPVVLINRNEQFAFYTLLNCMSFWLLHLSCFTCLILHLFHLKIQH